jgi:hypothetical protein
VVHGQFHEWHGAQQRVKAAEFNGSPYFIWESPTTGWVQYWFESEL